LKLQESSLKRKPEEEGIAKTKRIRLLLTKRKEGEGEKEVLRAANPPRSV